MMARKQSLTSPKSKSAATVPSAIGHKTRRGRPRKQQTIDHAAAAMNVIQLKTAQGSSPRITSSNEETDAENGDANTFEADDKADDDEDGDALAPFGCATERCGDQTGHVSKDGEKRIGHNSGQKARRLHAARLGSPSPVLKKTSHPRRNIPQQGRDCDSGGNGYSGVDDMSYYDDEPNLERLEEKDIIKHITRSEDGNSAGQASDPVSETVSEAGTWNGFDIGDGFFPSDIPYFDEQYGRTDPGILNSDIEVFKSASMFEGHESRPSLPQLPPQPSRHVHFEEPDMSPSNSSEIVSNDIDLDGLFDSNSRPEVEVIELSSFGRRNLDEGDDDSFGGNSSGYESDIGDTTEEEDIPVSATTPQALLRDPSLDVATSSAEVPHSAALSPSPFKIPATPTRFRSGPRLGFFKPNPEKAFGMVDSTGDNILYRPAKRPVKVTGSFSQAASTSTSTANASPVLSQPTLANALNDSDVDYSDFSNQGATNPMLTTGSESMANFLGPARPSVSHQRQPDWAGSVFFPQAGMDQVNALYPAYDNDDDGNDDEDLLNVDDFIDYGYSSDEDKDDVKMLDTVLPTPSSTSPTAASTHTQAQISSPSNTSTNGLMAHFDKGVIGAFRQSQNQHRYQPHRPHNGLSLNSHPFKSGRQPPANPPNNSQKKRKTSSGFAHTVSVGPNPKKRLTHHR